MGSFTGHCAVLEKNPYQPHGSSLEIPRGKGVLKAKLLEAKYEAKWEFPGRTVGAKNKKTFYGGEYGYFLELHNPTSKYRTLRK